MCQAVCQVAHQHTEGAVNTALYKTQLDLTVDVRIANEQLLVSLSVIFPPPMLNGARSLNSQLLGLKGTSSWLPVILGDDRLAVRDHPRDARARRRREADEDVRLEDAREAHERPRRRRKGHLVRRRQPDRRRELAVKVLQQLERTPRLVAERT